MKILLSGGGTLGPVAPLLAIYEIYQKHNPGAKFIWVGTSKGPEKALVEGKGIPFYVIASGKLRRYFSFWNFIDIFKIIAAFFQSVSLIKKESPDLLVSAGGFVSVPLHLAAWFMKVPTWVHQQDLDVGLANKIMAPFAKKVTVAIQDSVKFFKKAEWIGNPVRSLSVSDISESYEKFDIPVGAPVVLALGGGTGSATVNKLVLETLSLLPADWHVIHLVGRERPRELQEKATSVYKNYRVYQFLTDEMKDAYAIASVVVSRAGFATITELACLKKPAVLLPILGTHQEFNANFLAERGAAIVLNEKVDGGLKLADVLKDLMSNPRARQSLGNNLNAHLPSADPNKVGQIIDLLTKKE